MDIKVSVIVTVYNSEKYLKKTIDSILGQTLGEIQVILVDDGSTDGSLFILREYEALDQRVQVLENHEKTDGAAAARNLGISVAHGKYLSILDADDFFETDMLEKAYQKACETSADIVIYDGYRYDDRNQVDLARNSILSRDKLPQGKEIFSPKENTDNLFLMTLGAAWNVLFSSEQVRRYGIRFQSFHHADDFEFVYLNFALAKKIAILPERLVHYRVNHAGSQASRINEWPDTAWRSMLSFKDKLSSLGLYEKYRVAYVRVAMRYLSFYIDEMRSTKSFYELYDSLRNGQLEALDLLDVSADEFGDSQLGFLRDLIKDAPPEEYLFRKLYQDPPFDRAVSWRNNITKKSKLIIYGADRMGADAFHSILWERDYKVVAWVDRQYEELGYPIISPDMIPEFDFDYILITILSERTYKMIVTALVQKGIPKDKIKWIAEDRGVREIEAAIIGGNE